MTCSNDYERKRSFCGRIRVDFDTKKTCFEVADAVPFGGPAGTYRVRVNRRWHDIPDGGPLFLDRDGIVGLLSEAIRSVAKSDSVSPVLAEKTRVRVFIGNGPDGRPRYERTWTVTPPIRAADGRWKIAVVLFGKGTVFVDCDDVETKEQSCLEYAGWNISSR